MPDENKLYKLQELPSAIRQDLPVFSVSALLYSSNPDSRMVRINEQMMHEGQDLDRRGKTGGDYQGWDYTQISEIPVLCWSKIVF